MARALKELVLVTVKDIGHFKPMSFHVVLLRARTVSVIGLAKAREDLLKLQIPRERLAEHLQLPKHQVVR